MKPGQRFMKDTIEVLEYVSVRNDMGGVKVDWTPTTTFKGFLDTPDAREILQGMQLQQPFDRNLYYASNQMLPKKVRLRYTHPSTGVIEMYELVGKASDQGGQGRFMMQALKLV